MNALPLVLLGALTTAPVLVVALMWPVHAILRRLGGA